MQVFMCSMDAITIRTFILIRIILFAAISISVYISIFIFMLSLRGGEAHAPLAAGPR